MSRETIRLKVVERVESLLLGDSIRVRWPGYPDVDVSVDKSPYLNVDVVYIDGTDTGLGPKAASRLIGTLVLEFNFKQASPEAMQRVNGLLDRCMKGLTSNDKMFPLRTGPTRQVTLQKGAEQSWNREGLVTPFWIDIPKWP